MKLQMGIKFAQLNGLSQYFRRNIKNNKIQQKFKFILPNVDVQNKKTSPIEARRVTTCSTFCAFMYEPFGVATSSFRILVAIGQEAVLLLMVEIFHFHIHICI